MYGLLKTEPKPVSIEYLEVADPSPEADQVVIGIRAAGICGTDISMYHWKPQWALEYGPKLPVVMGHEATGEVVAIGREVTRYKLGDRVVPFPLIYCGKCEYCLSGRESICPNRPMLGAGLPGLMADYAVVREKNVYPVPDGLPWDVAAVAEPMCVAMHSLDRTALSQGETVFVAGPGPIGFAIALAAMGSGSGQVFISGLESDEYRLKLAAQQGVIPIIVSSNETDERPIDAVRRMTDGRGVDVAYEVSGTPGGLDQCMGVVRRGGRIGMVGQGFTPATLAAGTVSYMEISLIGVRGGTPRIWQKAGAFLLRNSNLIKNMVTHQVPLSKGVEAFQTMLAGKGMKILLLPGS